MARVKRGVVAGRRHKKILKKAKGYFNARRKVFRTAKQAVIKAGQYAYRGRREKKREFRALWITRINAAARLCGMTYSTLIDGLNKAGLAIDRKVLADLAVHDMPAFTAIAEKARAETGGRKKPRPSPRVFRHRGRAGAQPTMATPARAARNGHGHCRHPHGARCACARGRGGGSRLAAPWKRCASGCWVRRGCSPNSSRAWASCRRPNARRQARRSTMPRRPFKRPWRLAARSSRRRRCAPRLPGAPSM